MGDQSNELDASKIDNIYTISPSQINTLKTCKLKLVFQKIIKENYFPDHPSTLLGNVIHQILRSSNEGSLTSRDFEQAWNQVYHLESKKFLEKNCHNALYEPNLKYWIPYYASKKKITFERIQRKRSRRSHNARTAYESEIIYDFIKGTLDAILISGANAYIIDYKTGPIYKYEHGKKSGVKDQYLEQMKTYGFLLYKNEGLPPQNIVLRLENISSTEAAELILSSEDYENHYRHLQTLFIQINEAIDARDIESLANPNTQNCTLCKFRPRCKKFNELARSNSKVTENDLFLFPIEIRHNGNRISVSNSTGVSVEGIPNDLLVYIKSKKDNGLYFYGLIRGKKEGVFYWSKYSKTYNFF
jgi:CRISPR/Cas system-associated exonuclease Cas4 (RecB family)